MPITCMVCGRESQRISPAHVKTHNMTVAEYKVAYPDAPIVSPELSSRLSERQREVQGAPEARQKMSAACKAVEKTPEWNKRNSEAQRGKVIPTDVKEKMSESAKVRYAEGRNGLNSPEMQDRIREIQKTESYREAHARGLATKAPSSGDGLNNRVAAILRALELAPEREYALGPYLFDFAFPTAKVALEVQGCRWHMCPEHPKVWADLPEAQVLKRRRIDSAKKTYAANHGWTLVYVWEHDLPKSDEEAEKVILDRLPEFA
jgi:very-short-patch-repair endonuclease